MKLTRLLAPLATVLTLAACSGCVSAKYKSASSATPPPVVLNLTSAPVQPVRVDSPAGEPNPAAVPPTAEVTVHSVIVFHGPGSWKREAYWDEYVLSIANRGATPLTVDAATLTDFQGTPTSPGTDPWEVEKQSHSYVANAPAVASQRLEIGNGAAAAPDGLLATGATVTGGYAGYAAVGMAITATPIGLPVYAVAAIFVNAGSKAAIVDQFDRRRLKLPLTLAPGQVMQGSLFFRITPGPQRLALHGRSGDAPRELVVHLAPLAGLHLNSKTALSASQRSPALSPPTK